MGADVGGLAFVRKVGTPPFAIWGVILSFVGSMVYFGMVPLWSSLLVFSVLCEGTSMVMDLLQRERRILRASNMPAPKNEGKQYTWEEVAQHNDAESAWIAIRGKVYDVTTFLDRHPGGFELLLLCCGRDATDLFISYHPFTKVPEQVLKKFEIGTVLTYEHATYREDSGFYAECSQRIKEYFEKNKIDPKDPLLMTKRMIPVYVVGSIVFYIAFLSQDTYSWTVRILAALAFGVCQVATSGQESGRCYTEAVLCQTGSALTERDMLSDTVSNKFVSPTTGTSVDGMDARCFPCFDWTQRDVVVWGRTYFPRLGLRLLHVVVA